MERLQHPARLLQLGGSERRIIETRHLLALLLGRRLIRPNTHVRRPHIMTARGARDSLLLIDTKGKRAFVSVVHGHGAPEEHIGSKEEGGADEESDTRRNMRIVLRRGHGEGVG